MDYALGDAAFIHCLFSQSADLEKKIRENLKGIGYEIS